MENIFFLVVIVIILAVTFDFLNGFHDASNVVATIISTKAVEPVYALVFAGVGNFVGPFLFGTKIAKTIGTNITDPSLITSNVIICGLVGAIIWNIFTWYFGLPSSSSHAIIGGIFGSVLVAKGVDFIKWKGFGEIILVLITSPIIGLIFGFVIQKIFLSISYGFKPTQANKFYRFLQIPTSLALSLSHGTNDAQKSMGIITMTLISANFLNSFHVPFWVVFVCAFAMGLGTLLGGWRIIKTVGMGIYKLRPIHGFSSQFSAATVILGASLIGGPVSTTHIVSSSIMGVGTAERIKSVKWQTAMNIFQAWIFTIPASGCVAGLVYFILKLFFQF